MHLQIFAKSGLKDDEFIAFAADVDDADAGIFGEGAAEAGDEDLEAASVEEVIVAPEVKEEVLHGDNFAAGTTEAAEDFGLTVGQVRGFAFRQVFKRLRGRDETVISYQVFTLFGFLPLCHIGFAHQSLDTDDEFLDGKWFFEVIVGSQFEAGYDIVRGGFGREEEDGCMVIGLADAADHLKAVQTGHHHIGNKDVGMNFKEAFESFGTIVGGLNDVALASEGFTDDLDEGLFVFNEEDFDGAHRFFTSFRMTG